MVKRYVMVIKYVLRGYVLCDVLREYVLRVMYYVYVLRGYELHITQYVIRGYPYITSPRSFRLKVCLRVGNGLTFWNWK